MALYFPTQHTDNANVIMQKNIARTIVRAIFLFVTISIYDSTEIQSALNQLSDILFR